MKSKRSGEVNEYLTELLLDEEEAKSEGGESKRGFERWLLTDWLRPRRGKSNVKKGALPFLKKAKWNSGDNVSRCLLHSSAFSSLFSSLSHG
jgi:hypothetical protein